MWTPGVDHFVYLQSDDGTPVGPIAVTKGVADWYLVMAEDPGITPRTGASWKTIYAFGHDGDEGSDIEPDAPRVAIVIERDASGPREATLNLLFDHEFVHEDPGDPPPDDYALDGGTIPNLAVTGLTAEAVYSGVILEEDGDPLLEEDGSFFLEEDATAGVVINVDWANVSGATLYSMRWRRDGGAWHSGFTSVASEGAFGISANGTYEIRVKATSGSTVGPESSTSIVITGF